MSAFILEAGDLTKLAAINFFPIPENAELIFFGLRGCLPVDLTNYDFAGSHELTLRPFDHRTLACTLGQWKPHDNSFAVFPGSTVPNRTYLRGYRKTLNAFNAWKRDHPNASATEVRKETKKVKKSNMLLTGFFPYVEGLHNNYPAFRLAGSRKQPILRTHDDLEFEATDVYEVSNPTDNIHYASCDIHGKSQSGKDWFGSAGCQVVAGFAQKQIDPHPWVVFRDNGYQADQTVFPYMLLNGRDAFRAAANRDRPMRARLRFGSRIEEANSVIHQLQEALRPSYYTGPIDGDFGPGMFDALRNFQDERISPEDADGIVGPNTADALEVPLPMV